MWAAHSNFLLKITVLKEEKETKFTVGKTGMHYLKVGDQGQHQQWWVMLIVGMVDMWWKSLYLWSSSPKSKTTV